MIKDNEKLGLARWGQEQNLILQLAFYNPQKQTDREKPNSKILQMMFVSFDVFLLSFFPTLFLILDLNTTPILKFPDHHLISQILNFPDILPI